MKPTMQSKSFLRVEIDWSQSWMDCLLISIWGISLRTSVSVCGFPLNINSYSHNRVDFAGTNTDTVMAWHWLHSEIHCISYSTLWWCVPSASMSNLWWITSYYFEQTCKHMWSKCKMCGINFSMCHILIRKSTFNHGPCTTCVEIGNSKDKCNTEQSVVALSSSVSDLHLHVHLFLSCSFPASITCLYALLLLYLSIGSLHGSVASSFHLQLVDTNVQTYL